MSPCRVRPDRAAIWGDAPRHPRRLARGVLRHLSPWRTTRRRHSTRRAIGAAVANHVALRTPEREAYFSDYTLNPDEVRGEPLLDGAVVRTKIEKSRAVYWGFDLGSVVDRPWDRAVALRLTRNSVAWAAGLPLATIEPWPNGK